MITVSFSASSLAGAALGGAGVGAAQLAAPHAMGAGMAMLVTIGLVVAGLIALEIWLLRRKRRRAAAKQSAERASGDRGPAEESENEARKGTVLGVFAGALFGGLGWLWSAAFGSPHEQPDPTLDMDPDELAELRENEDVGGDGRPFG